MVAVQIVILESSETERLENWEKINMNCIKYLKRGLNALNNFLSVKLQTLPLLETVHVK